MVTVSEPIRLKKAFDIIGPEPMTVDYEVVPQRKTAAKTSEVTLQVQASRKGKGMNPRHINTITLFTAGASCAYAAAMILTFGGILLGLIPLWAIERIATWWGLISLGYVISQLPHPLFALQMTDPNFKVDRYSSYVPLAVLVVFSVLFLLWKPPVFDVWIMVFTSALAIIADFLIFPMAITIRTRIEAAARRGENG